MTIVVRIGLVPFLPASAARRSLRQAGPPQGIGVALEVFVPSERYLHPQVLPRGIRGEAQELLDRLPGLLYTAHVAQAGRTDPVRAGETRPFAERALCQSEPFLAAPRQEVGEAEDIDPQEREAVDRAQSQRLLERTDRFLEVADEDLTDAEVAMRPRKARVERHGATQPLDAAIDLAEEQLGASQCRLRHLVARVERHRPARHLVAGDERLASRRAPAEKRVVDVGESGDVEARGVARILLRGLHPEAQRPGVVLAGELSQVPLRAHRRLPCIEALGALA